MTEEEERITYLKMIQAAIDRMSTSSAIFKGFCATIVAGISAISFADTNKWILVLNLVPIVCFLILDIYYLQLEKRFRNLYEAVRNREKDVDFDLTPPKTKEMKKADLWYCMKSPSIYLFYVPMIAVSVVTIFLKLRGVV